MLLLLGTAGPDNVAALGLVLELEHNAGLTGRVIGQAERRGINGEKIPAPEKVV